MTTFVAIEAGTTLTPRPPARRRDAGLQDAITAGYVTLARAMVRAALADALKSKDAETREEAAAWLGSDDGLEIAELCGFDAELIKKWYFAGCPAKNSEIQQ